jgi:hypothetical protein
MRPVGQNAVRRQKREKLYMAPDDRLASLTAVADATTTAELSTGQAVKFLLADFEALLKLKEESVKVSDRRIDVLLAIISAVGAGLAILSQTHIAPRDFLYVAAFGLLGLATLSITTYRQTINRDILTADYIRALNAIRSFFAERSPLIQPYLLMPVSSDVPRYGRHSQARQTTVVINSLLVGVGAAVIYLLIAGMTSVDLIALGIASGSAAFTFATLTGFAYLLYSLAERKARTRAAQSTFALHERVHHRRGRVAQDTALPNA